MLELQSSFPSLGFSHCISLRNLLYFIDIKPLGQWKMNNTFNLVRRVGGYLPITLFRLSCIFCGGVSLVSRDSAQLGLIILMLLTHENEFVYLALTLLIGAICSFVVLLLAKRITIMSCRVLSETDQKRSMWIWRKNSAGRPATPGPSDFPKSTRIRKISAPPELPPIKDAVPSATTRKRSQTVPCLVKVRQGASLHLDPKNSRPSTGHKNNLILRQQAQFRRCSSMQNLPTFIFADGMLESKALAKGLANHFQESPDQDGAIGHPKLTEEKVNFHKTKYSSEDSMSDVKKEMILRWLNSTKKKNVICAYESLDHTLPQL